MHRGQHSTECGIVAGPFQLDVLEYQKRFLLRLSMTERRRDPRAGRGQRFEAVAFGGEAVRLQTVVDLREKSTPAASEDIRTMDAASRRRRRALKAECNGRIRDGCLDCGEEFPGSDHAARRVSRVCDTTRQ